MSIKAIANGSNEAERQAAHYANEVQDGVNLIAIVGCFSSSSDCHERCRGLRRQAQ